MKMDFFARKDLIGKSILLEILKKGITKRRQKEANKEDGRGAFQSREEHLN